MRVNRTSIAARCVAGTFGVAAVLALPAAAAGAADAETTSASLNDVNGKPVGTVTFSGTGGGTVMTAEFVTNSTVKPGYHGFHIHANNLPDGGEGCVADPKADPKTWFASADGHLADTGQSHGAHWGDMPSVYITKTGTGTVSFTFEHTRAADLVNRAVVLHALADNYGNVPVGDAPDQYKPNSEAATTATAKTGNSGTRIACGVIKAAGAAKSEAPAATTKTQGVVPLGAPATGSGGGNGDADSGLLLLAGTGMLAAAVAVSGFTLHRGSRRTA